MRFRTAIATLVIFCLSGTTFAKVTAKKFSHKPHIASGIACASCHEGISGKDSLAPTKISVDCSSCHEAAKVKSPKGEWAPTSALLFSHKNHIERTSGDCNTCHSQISKNKLPGHKECLTCHGKDYDDVNCRKCHSDLGSMDIVPISDYSHTTNWMQRHKLVASKDKEVCAKCHEQSFCSNCHNIRDDMRQSEKFPEDVERKMIHRADYRTRHPIEARANSASCMRCHDIRSCLDCHRREAVTTGVANYPHPAGWMSAGSADFHGRVARQDIVLCASCHENGTATNCVVCHRSGSGNNPHPPGWSTSISQSATVCKSCH